METAIVSIICVALVLFGGMTLSQGFLTSVDSTTAELGKVSNRGEEIMRTDLNAIGSSLNVDRDTLSVTLQNNGHTKLADFDKWDVIVQYHDDGGNYYTVWLPYTGGALGDNQWEVQWIHLDGGDEVFEPGVLNPGEDLQIRAKLNPAVGDNTTNLVVVSTPNGVATTSAFSP